MNKAFSLVELSIVLVILGLLTGGILTGQSLIRAAEMRSITTQMMGYQTAVYTFRNKYFYLPGDMLNATDFWGSVTTSGDTCPGTAGSDAGTGTETCNGDGDGSLENRGGFASSDEVFRFWDHLASAGLIEGSYTGITGTGSNIDAMPGTNAPSGKISSSCFAVGGAFTADASSSFFEREYGIRLFFGGGGDDSSCTDDIMTPEEAWGIDTKMDDGLPAQGKVMTRESCADSTVVSTAKYDLSDTSIKCMLLFQPGW